MKRSGALRMMEGAAGADEVGRGALAGPVVCAAVVLPQGFDPKGLDDSKKLTRAQREVQAARIAAEALWAVEFVEAEEVDRINVLQASLQGMARAFARLAPMPSLLLVDGSHPPFVAGVEVQCHVKGDGAFAAIAAASILAKVARDRWMAEQEAFHPGYGFCRHVGYAAPEHLDALKRLGPCPLHRRTFEPVRSMLEQPLLPLG